MAKDLSVRFKSWSEFSRELAQSYRHLELPTDTITDTHKYESINKIPFFSDFSEIETWEIVRISTWHRHPAGKDINEKNWCSLPLLGTYPGGEKSCFPWGC